MFIPFLTNFLIDQIGITYTSIIMPFYGIINVLTSVLMGNMSDIVGKYPTFMKIQTGQIALWLVLVILIFYKLYFIFAIFYVFSSFFSVILNGTTGAYLYDMAKNENEIKKFNTINYIMFNIGVLLGPIIGGLVFEKYSFYVLLINLIFLIIQLIIFKLIFKKTNSIGSVNIKQNLILSKKLISKNFNFAYYLLLILIGIIWVGVYDSVMPTFYIQKHQSLTIWSQVLNSHQLISVTLVINGLLLILITTKTNKLVNDLNVWTKYFIICGLLILANLLFFIPNPWLVIVTIIIFTFAEVIMPVAQTQIIYQISDDTNRSQYITFYSSATMFSISISNIFNYLIIKTSMLVVAITLLTIGLITITLILKNKKLYRRYVLKNN